MWNLLSFSTWNLHSVRCSNNITREKKSKVKLSCYRHVDIKGEKTYSSYSLLTTTLDGVSGQCHAPAALYPRKMTPGTH
jgi:hypothetical protein